MRNHKHSLYFVESWRLGTGPCIRIELTPYEVGLLRRTGKVLEQLNWLQEVTTDE